MKRRMLYFNTPWHMLVENTTVLVYCLFIKFTRLKNVHMYNQIVFKQTKVEGYLVFEWNLFGGGIIPLLQLKCFNLIIMFFVIGFESETYEINELINLWHKKIAS